MALSIQNSTLADDFALRFPNPGAIWTPAWVEIRQRLLLEAMGGPRLQAAFAAGEPLPAGYGAAMDERVVEWPWVLSNGPRGHVLDAGSALNHAEVLAHYLPCVDDLHIVTLEPEDQAYTATASPTSSPTCATCPTATTCSTRSCRSRRSSTSA
jgi:hypothetical protein